MRVVLLVPALLVAFLCQAQDDYVVTLKSDTIRGSVKIMGYDLMDRIQIAQDGKKKTILTALQVRQVNINHEIFAPVRVDNTIRMMKLMRTGFLSLYAFRPQGQVSYEGRILVKIGSPPLEVPNLGFKKFVGDFVVECPDVADKIKSGDFNRMNITEMVDAYNDCVQARSERKFDNLADKTTNPATEAINELRQRVSNSNLDTKQDVTDLLNNLLKKVQKNEPVPQYLKDGLRGYLLNNPDFKEDTEKVLKMLN